jgi:hypothetical protein
MPIEIQTSARVVHPGVGKELWPKCKPLEVEIVKPKCKDK